MKLNNIWGYGQLFGFSGLDGQSRFLNDFVGTLTSRKIEIRMELQEWVKIYFPVKGRVKFRAITGDMIDASTKEGDVVILFRAYAAENYYAEKVGVCQIARYGYLA